jgi:hypothetical protein
MRALSPSVEGTYAKLDGMYDATNFWLLTGTSAPVIILANVVLFGDAWGQLLDLRSIRGGSAATFEQKKLATTGLRFAYATTILAYSCLFTETIVLWQAAHFFTFGGKGLWAPSTQFKLLMFGMGAILFGSIFSSYAKHSVAEIERASSKSPPDKHPDPST